jgi:hypothetical protein
MDDEILSEAKAGGESEYEILSEVKAVGATTMGI